MLTCLSHKIEEMRKEYHKNQEYDRDLDDSLLITYEIILFLGGWPRTNWFMEVNHNRSLYFGYRCYTSY